MAKDINKALREMVARHGNMSAEIGDEYVTGMSKNKRYVRDVYLAVDLAHSVISHLRSKVVTRTIWKW